jgi:hypothetical protein
LTTPTPSTDAALAPFAASHDLFGDVTCDPTSLECLATP